MGAGAERAEGEGRKKGEKKKGDATDRPFLWP